MQGKSENQQLLRVQKKRCCPREKARQAGLSNWIKQQNMKHHSQTRTRAWKSSGWLTEMRNAIVPSAYGCVPWRLSSSSFLGSKPRSDMPMRAWLVTLISDKKDPLFATPAVTVSQAPSHLPPAIASAAYLLGRGGEGGDRQTTARE